MSEYRDHGGRCCGIFHIYGMDRGAQPNGNALPTLDDTINRHFSRRGGYHLPANNRNDNRVLEIILSHRQVFPANDRDNDRIPLDVLEGGGWAKCLEARGFRLSFVWKNSNTRNNCYAFHKVNRWEDIEAIAREMDWNGEINVPALPQALRPRRPVVPERRIEVREFYANLRNGGLRGPFETEEAARQSYPRCRNFQARTIFNDGTSRYDNCD